LKDNPTNQLHSNHSPSLTSTFPMSTTTSYVLIANPGHPTVPQAFDNAHKIRQASWSTTHELRVNPLHSHFRMPAVTLHGGDIKPLDHLPPHHNRLTGQMGIAAHLLAQDCLCSGAYMQLQIVRSRAVRDVFNVMISQDWDPEEDEWKGINIRNIEFANTGTRAATPNCDDTLDTWGPVCKPCKPILESSLPDLKPITPPHSSQLLPGDRADCPIFVEDSSPAPRSLSLPPCNPTTKAWVKAIHAQRQASTPPRGRSPTIRRVVKKPSLESMLPCWHCRELGHKKLLCPNKHLPRVRKTQSFRPAVTPWMADWIGVDGSIRV
jgi:hypothetical protein